ncbi:MAG: hypothetical protein JWL61_2669, partial [Gemmatimonadetes bacterium]|nr:hypothetical protein [Gemmatimonadota bacterium]
PARMSRDIALERIVEYGIVVADMSPLC